MGSFPDMYNEPFEKYHSTLEKCTSLSVNVFSKKVVLWDTMGASIQQEFRLEISEIARAQWNGTFRLHRPVPNHRVFGYCSCKQYTKQRYWGQQFCQMEGDISVRPDQSKCTTFKAGLEYFGRTKPKWSVPSDARTEISEISG